MWAISTFLDNLGTANENTTNNKLIQLRQSDDKHQLGQSEVNKENDIVTFWTSLENSKTTNMKARDLPRPM